MATKGLGDCGVTANESITIDEDRISELPDALVHYILSFLFITYIVQMCLLSKRWRRVEMVVAQDPFCFSLPSLKDLTLKDLKSDND
ncbi:hypothetical protein FNV43_RR01703 [Rhamnella rubrinervis]|uniref:F-box domain-containing protein n=1 Tax=Rhamnella rubrinervis TaxID=2594499 RepID=A0A8K0HQW9_9ROSA|nr:hypothetical protein FNV43_RR01703 [Rhamnella rubrinervis]